MCSKSDCEFANGQPLGYALEPSLSELNTSPLSPQTSYMCLKACFRVMARITNQEIAKEDDKGEKDTEEYLFR